MVFIGILEVGDKDNLHKETILDEKILAVQVHFPSSTSGMTSLN